MSAERFVRVGGVAHHVVVDGTGPVCVLSAGLAMSWFDWDPVVPLLAPYRTVVRFDRPGHGLSAPAPAAPSAAAEAHRIAGLLDALGLPGPATVVGHSLAGFHAEAFARMHPGRTAGLVLVDSSVEEHARVPAAPALRTAAVSGLGAVLTALGVPAAVGPLARRAAVRLSRHSGGDPAPAALVRRCYATSRVMNGALLENAHYRAVAAELLALRARSPLPAGLPVTVLAAPDGSPRWAERQRGLARRLGARFEAVEPSGHLMMLDRPDAVARAVLDLDQCDV
ncbi:alpha/beta hydrolase [Streptomyces solicathayae]|uniref:Alpha/beta hydrolase n=1 Tax=Streptomyces solicathayae TaxID=3081768 RepID=A0ABZ0LZ64_9ACTN|nr:alpha/beta hydrolase [Streptomyces sp. HUAS YS2]WOX24724.1 alpha/beta hydrolase [Streptomyces sp. HUAS YS2]